MVVLTKRASDEFVIDKPTRMVCLETAPDHVTLGLLNTDEGVEESRRVTPPAPDRGTVKLIAPYGEEIEIDA